MRTCHVLLAVLAYQAQLSVCSSSIALFSWWGVDAFGGIAVLQGLPLAPWARPSLALPPHKGHAGLAAEPTGLPGGGEAMAARSGAAPGSTAYECYNACVRLHAGAVAGAARGHEAASVGGPLTAWPGRQQPQQSWELQQSMTWLPAKGLEAQTEAQVIPEVALQTAVPAPP